MGTIFRPLGFDPLVIYPILAVIVVLSISACVHIACKKGFNPGWFIALGFFLGPIGVIVSILIKKSENG